LTKLELMIDDYERRLKEIDEEIKESEALNNEDFNPMDASGGNFDDAYRLGIDHGDIFARYEEIYEFVKRLKEFDTV